MQSDEMRPIVQNQQRAVDDSLTRRRNIGHLIGRVIPTGRSIEVVTEIDAYLFKVFDNRLTLEIFRTVESHVFEKVSQTLLRIVLLNRTDIVQDIEIGLAFRFFIVADVVGHAVRQFTHTQLLVDRNGFRLHLSYRTAHRKDCDEQNRQFFHTSIKLIDKCFHYSWGGVGSGSGRYSITSPGWQSSSLQIASSVENRTAFAFPFLSIERLAGVMSMRRASSPSGILRLAIMTSMLMIIAMNDFSSLNDLYY